MNILYNLGQRLQESPAADCDYNRLERWVNVVTSLPYALVGAYMLPRLKGRCMKGYAVSQIAVGAAAGMYHASSGPARVWMRRMDYWVIALGSVVMTRAGTVQLFPIQSLRAGTVQRFLIQSLPNAKAM